VERMMVNDKAAAAELIAIKSDMTIRVAQAPAIGSTHAPHGVHGSAVYTASPCPHRLKTRTRVWLRRCSV
jgi:hypothetical protein